MKLGNVKSAEQQDKGLINYTMNKYCSYLRVSTDKQGISGLGMDSQRHLIKHFIRDGELIKEFIEVKSGATLNERPQLKAAIEYCIKNDCHLIVGKLDRLSRNVDDCRDILKLLKGKLHACDLPDPIDKFTLTLFAAFAERQREYISVTTSNALQAKLRRGEKWQLKAGETTSTGKISAPAIHNGTALKASIESKKNKAKTNPNNIRAKAVIKSQLNQGKKTPEIVQYLNANQFKTSKNNNFTFATVQRLAR